MQVASIADRFLVSPVVQKVQPTGHHGNLCNSPQGPDAGRAQAAALPPPLENRAAVGVALNFRRVATRFEYHVENGCVAKTAKG